MGWSQLKNEDTYLGLNSDWNSLLSTPLPVPTFPGISIPSTQVGFGWTFSQMGYKGVPNNYIDFIENKSVGAFRVNPTVYTFSFYYRKSISGMVIDQKVDNGVPTAKPGSHLKKLGLYYNTPKTFKKNKVYQFNTTLINYLQIGGNSGTPNNPDLWRSPILYMVTPLGGKSEILAHKNTLSLNYFDSTDTVPDTDQYDKKSDTFILPWPFFESKPALDTIENTSGRIFNIHYYSSPNEDVVSYLNERPTIFYSSVLFGNSHNSTTYRDIIKTNNIRKYEFKSNGSLKTGSFNYINDGEGIVGQTVNEMDWLIQGFSYVSLFNIVDNKNVFFPKPWTMGGSLFGNGWYSQQNSYIWYDKPKSTVGVWQDQQLSISGSSDTTIYTPIIDAKYYVLYLLRDGDSTGSRQQTNTPVEVFAGCPYGSKLKNSFGWDQYWDDQSGPIQPKVFLAGTPMSSYPGLENLDIINNITLGGSYIGANGRITPPVGSYRITIKSILMQAKQGKLVQEGLQTGNISLVSNTRTVKIQVLKNGNVLGTAFESELIPSPTDTYTPLGKLVISGTLPDFYLNVVSTTPGDYFEIRYLLDGELVAISTDCANYPATPAVMDVSFWAQLSYKFEQVTTSTNTSTTLGTPYKFIANDPYYNMPVGGPWSGGSNIDVPNWVDYYGFKSDDSRQQLSLYQQDGGGSGLFGYSKSPHEGFRKNNYIARFINQDKFNLSFKYQNDRGDNTGLKFYLSDTLPSQKPINSHLVSKASNLVIRDWATVVDTINVSSYADFLKTAKTLKEIKVTINLQHTWDGDLIINLKGPRENDSQGFGKVINLFNREKGNSDNFVNTIFSSSDSNKSIYYGLSPFLDTFKMRKDIGVGYDKYRSNTKYIKDLLPLGGLNPGTVIGNWTLYIKDDAGLDVGVLQSWAIEFIFDNTSNINYLGTLTQSVDRKSYNFYGLQGNQYLIFVADAITSPIGSTYTVVKLDDLAIEDSYHPQNNTLVTVGTSSIVTSNYKNNNSLLFTPSGINGKYSYQASVGSGNTLNATQSLTYSVVHTRAGTGRFTSGIWENGNWINGWREDTKIYQFFDIQQFFSYDRDKRWRFTVVGPSYHTSQFKIGDKVSISNVVAININEERKLIKNYFTIINKTANTLVVEFEFDFPIRRVQKDSQYHFINITKNIWLNGNFFNGYFKGNWTDGLFYGYPFITEMYNSHWIDGTFKGGHFKSNPVLLPFDSLSLSNNNVVVNFGLTHSFNSGDSIYLNEFSDESQNSVLFGDCIIISILNNSSIVTSLTTNDILITSIKGGYVKSDKNTALIQNINVDTLNVSTISSNKSLDDRRVFSYNTWMDLVFDENSATNILKPQTNLNYIYPIGDTSVYYSNNNLYGYITYDLLSSDSKFRDSFTTVIRNYKLGTKYKIFHDYIGDSSYFDDFFTDTVTNPQKFKDLGWNYNSSISTDIYNPNIKFERTVETTDDSEINGKELRVLASYDGGVLNLDEPSEEIPGRYTEKIKQNRYTMVEFDLISKNIQENFFLGDDISLNYIPYPMEQPTLHFGNLNLISRKIISPQDNSYYNNLIYPTYLPIYKNINHAFTPNKKKFEYFYNKRDLMMTFRGSGSGGKEQSEFIIDNLKLYEIDMIPFFKYFTYENINRTVQIPIESKTPYKKPDYFSGKIITLSHVSYNTNFGNSVTQDTAAPAVSNVIFNTGAPGSAQIS
jgi:subtilisin-like proprotein convertase family protein